MELCAMSRRQKNLRANERAQSPLSVPQQPAADNVTSSAERQWQTLNVSGQRQTLNQRRYLSMDASFEMRLMVRWIISRKSAV
jgi:hypothetical protein